MTRLGNIREHVVYLLFTMVYLFSFFFILLQPMLCVSAVNPILFSKVPALVQVTGVRKRIGAMLPYVRCPFRMSIY